MLEYNFDENKTLLKMLNFFVKTFTNFNFIQFQLFIIFAFCFCFVMYMG